MSFEIKYDRDGKVLPGQAPVIEQEAPLQEVLEQVETQHEPQDQVEEVEVAQAAPAPVPVQPAPSESFKQLREARERAERERDELMRRLEEAEARKAAPVEEEERELAPDDLVEARYMNKKLKSLQQQIQQQQQQSYEMSVEAKLKAQFPDFDAVVNRDNIAQLKAAEPELASAINANPDLYAKAVAAYKTIKKFGIVVEDNYQKEREIVQKNAAKPRTLTSIAPTQGESPLSRANAFANGLTDELQKQLRKEMEDARRNM